MTTKVCSRAGGLLAVTVTAFTMACPMPGYAADKGAAPTRRASPEPLYEEPVAPAWRGLYWGMSFGYGFGFSEQSYDRNDNHGIASTEPTGGLGALTVGYNWMWSPRILLGIEGDIGLMDVSADDKIVYDGHIYKTSYGPWWGTLRGRAGYFVTPGTLLYATAGWAFMDVDEISIGNTPGETAVNEDFKSGVVLGAGLERALMPGVTAKLEYLHMDFGTYEGYSANREDYSFDNRVDLVRVGLNFKF